MSLEALHSYDFDNDPEYQTGLSSILDQFPAELPEDAKLATVLQAKCFYFSRKYDINPPLDPTLYKAYLDQSTSTNSTSPANNSIPSPTTTSTTSAPKPAPASTTTTPSSSEPTYPRSFAELVELITQNKPIPGIEEIPNTIIPDTTLHSLPEPGTAAARGRRKPWEKDEAVITTAAAEKPEDNATGATAVENTSTA